MLWLATIHDTGAGPVAPSIGMRVLTISQGGGVACIWIVHTRQGSVTVLQVTGSLLLQILLCYLIVVSFHSCIVNNRHLDCWAGLCLISGIDGV